MAKGKVQLSESDLCNPLMFVDAPTSATLSTFPSSMMNWEQAWDQHHGWELATC